MIKKNVTVKISAIIALIAIFSSIIGTGLLLIFETYFSDVKIESIKTNDISNEELQKILKNLSGSLSSSGNKLNINNIESGEIIKNNLSGSLSSSGNKITLSGSEIPK